MEGRNPDQEEDEGYLAAQAGLAADQNPYPSGTLRFDHWRRGWQIAQLEARIEQEHPDVSVDNNALLTDNPHPRGTIRYEEWREVWHAKQAKARRARRLGRVEC
ncbi:MAG: hypothetical protein ACJ8AW_18850 [Rhodopila sp.]